MKFSEGEIRFLMSKHDLEFAVAVGRPLREMVDLRALGCPEPIFSRVLEQRARQFGRRFTEFRATHAASVSTTEPSLQDRITGTKLF